MQLIPIKYKSRMFKAHQSRWEKCFYQAGQPSDFGRGESISGLIPNLQPSELEERLKRKYQRRFCVFTNCASDALDLAVFYLGFKKWYMPSYTWLSPANAIKKAGAEIVYLDVDPEFRCLTYEGYDPRFPVLIPHVDGYAAPPPPEGAAYVLEDAAQSPFGERINFGAALVLSFGSSKRLGLMGQGGCLLTDDPDLAEKMKAATVFGLNSDKRHVLPGSKSFLDPLNALCTLEILNLYEQPGAFRRLDEIRRRYEVVTGWKKTERLERFSIRVRRRDQFRRRMLEAGIETRVWLDRPCGQWPALAGRDAAPLLNTKRIAEQSVDIPFYEYLSDEEVERIEDALQLHRDFILHPQELE